MNPSGSPAQATLLPSASLPGASLPAGGTAPRHARLSAAIAGQEVTYDLARLMEPPVESVRCSGFADAVIKHFGG